MNEMMALDGNKMKKIAHASHSAEVTMTALAMRDRLRTFSDITRFKNKMIRDGERIVDADYMAFWKALQDAGVGVIVYGRKGKPDRFEWHYSLKKVAKAALEGTNETAERVGGRKRTPAKVELVRTKAPEVKAPVPVIAKPSATRFVYIPLRKDFSLQLTLPVDITKEEIGFISEALRQSSA